MDIIALLLCDARPGNGARGLKRARAWHAGRAWPDARPGNGARGLKLQMNPIFLLPSLMRAPATGRED